MFKNVRIIVKNIVKNTIKYNTENNCDKIILGRWKLENNDIKTNIKVDSANEDHCGTCIYTVKN